MNPTTTDLVLDHADHLGNLSRGDAAQLLRAHGFEMHDYTATATYAVHRLQARPLLTWLGY